MNADNDVKPNKPNFKTHNFKVVEIISEYEIIINFGKSDGATIGNKIVVYIPGSEVTDPDTFDVIEEIDVIKDELEVIKVYNNLSICAKIDRSKEKVFANLMNPLLKGVPPLKSQEVKLSVDSTQITGRQHETDDPIRVGDRFYVII